jgi:hypothetical protein
VKFWKKQRAGFEAKRQPGAGTLEGHSSTADLAGTTQGQSSPPYRATFIWLTAFILLGVAVRLVWLYYVNTQPIYDFKRYHDLAMSLLTKGTYTMPEGLDYIKQSTDYIQAGVSHPTAFRPPGYPLFLVALYSIYPSIVAAKLANVALSVVWMLCAFFLTNRYFGPSTALGATLLTAVFPPAVAYTSVLGTEILSVSLLLLIICVLTFRIGGAYGTHLLSGALAGFLALVKPYFIVFPALYLVILWWQKREEAQAVGEVTIPSAASTAPLAASPAPTAPLAASPAPTAPLAASPAPTGRANGASSARAYVRLLARSIPALTAATLGLLIMMALVISPWTIRNYQVFERFVPISTNGHFVLYINNNDNNVGKNMDVMRVPNSIFKTDRILQEDGTYNEVDAMRLAKAEAVDWISSHKLQYALLGIKRLSVSYFNTGMELYEWTMSKAQLRFDRLWISPLLLGARAAGLVVVGGGLVYVLLIAYHFFRRTPVHALHKVNLLFIAFFTMIIFATEGQPRYLFPMYPFFIAGVSWMAARLSAELRAK